MTSRPLARAGLPLVVLAALAFLAWVNGSAISRVIRLTSTGDEAPAIDATSPTGHAGGIRQLLIGNRDASSYQWISQAQAGIATGTWRLRHVDSDNAPDGREVLTPSPYRWWLSGVGWLHSVTGSHSLSAAIEHAAIHADALLHGLFLLVSALLVARWFGALAAGFHTLAAAIAHPFADALLAGMPTDHGLTLIAAWFAIVPLLATCCSGSPKPATDTRGPSLSAAWLGCGFCASLLVWLNAPTGLAVIAGIGAGALLETLSSSNEVQPGDERPWLTWSLGGATGVLGLFLLEYAPDHLTDWHLEVIHPAWGVAWLGVGLVLDWAIPLVRKRRFELRWSRLVSGTLGLAGIAGAFVLLRRTESRALFDATLALRPAAAPATAGTDSVFAWLAHTGGAAAKASVLTMLLLVGLAVWRGWSRRSRAMLAALGPVLVLGSLAAWRWYWWSTFAVTLLAITPVLIRDLQAERRAALRWLALGAAGFAFLPSLFLGIARANVTSSDFTEAEIVALVERDIAHWLKRRTGPDGAIVLAPPHLTASLCFHGGLRGIGTPAWENKEGIEGAIRLAGASSPDEGATLAERRKVGYIVLPSWDTSLDALVAANAPSSSTPLIALLRQFQAPRWLRPIPYPMPVIPGFEGRSVAVFQVVDVQDNALALSRLAEYFLEMQRPKEAVAVAITLEQAFPNDVTALIARILVAKAFRDTAGVSASAETLTNMLAATIDPLPWDRQVSLVVALMEAQRPELARTELEKCMADISETNLRSLSAASLYRLLLLCKINRLSIPDAALQRLALELLPPEMRTRVE